MRKIALFGMHHYGFEICKGITGYFLPLDGEKLKINPMETF
ncbi:hypothetical protein EMIT07CA2_550029 [Brevibacillus sp. IT-7CA2]